MPDAYSRKRRLTQQQAEKKLAEALGMLRSWGIQFRRQAPKGSTVVDFVSDEAKLVIELDADEEPEERLARYNATRTELLEARGYRFLRFWTKDVARDLAKVMATVMAVLREQHHRALDAKAAAAQATESAPDDPSGDNGLPPPRRRNAAEHS